MRTAYKPLVEEIADSAGVLLEALKYGRMRIQDYNYEASLGHPEGYEFKQSRLAEMTAAVDAVRACSSAMS